MDGPATPDRRPAYHRLGEVARLLRVAPSAIRYWQQEFHPHVHPSRTRSGQNVYSNRDVAVLGRIRQLVHDQGLSIRDAREALRVELADNQGVPAMADNGLQAEMDFTGQVLARAAPAPGRDDAMDQALADALAERDALARELDSARRIHRTLQQRHTQTLDALSRAIREIDALLGPSTDSKPR